MGNQLPTCKIDYDFRYKSQKHKFEEKNKKAQIETNHYTHTHM